MKWELTLPNFYTAQDELVLYIKKDCIVNCFFKNFHMLLTPCNLWSCNWLKHLPPSKAGFRYSTRASEIAETIKKLEWEKSAESSQGNRNVERSSFACKILQTACLLLEIGLKISKISKTLSWLSKKKKKKKKKKTKVESLNCSNYWDVNVHVYD